MAQATAFNMRQKAMFFRRIQVILIGVISVSALEYSAKRTDQLQADRATQRIATQRVIKTSVQRKASLQSIATERSEPQAKSSLKSSKTPIKSVQ